MRRLTHIASLTGLVLALVPATSLAATRTINFDDITAPTLFVDTSPAAEQYASLGCTSPGRPRTTAARSSTSARSP